MDRAEREREREGGKKEEYSLSAARKSENKGFWF